MGPLQMPGYSLLHPYFRSFDDKDCHRTRTARRTYLTDILLILYNDSNGILVAFISLFQYLYHLALEICTICHYNRK